MIHEENLTQTRLEEILEIKRRSMIIANQANTFEGLKEIIQAAKREQSNAPAISTIKMIIRDAKFFSTYYDAEIKLIRTGKVRLCGYFIGEGAGDD